MSQTKYWKAINEAMAEEMQSDERVVLLGEDVGKPGGTYGATRGLYDRFGPSRVRDTPISEATLVGLATGAAMTGLRPIVEIMFFDFLPLAADQLINHAAKVGTISGGAFEVPMVIRTMCGAGKNTGPQHGQSLETWVAHIPGLKVAWPSNPADAKGLLKSAIRDPNPVVMIESLALWGSRGEVDEQDTLVPFGKARVAVTGDDVTLVAWGRAVPHTIAAADALRTEHGISAEVLDLRSLSPLDTNAILSSVARTGRLVIVHDAVAPFGPGAEIAALAAGEGFYSLRAPVQRITPPFAPVPFAPILEGAYYPSLERVVQAAVEAVEPRARPSAVDQERHARDLG
jgi:pyruvate/2-oxoglutarate/acetoin dehydrogenase E1 component